ncbi:hypothetical protein ROG8370_00254 [Roseovarius gaetbuli]|uniref:Uncharacterized protein n=1 Tax=Roseovarius gaetbuli TaxID=1356575 RepID=A0A1X6Y700_9RHOB|nr:hypothetical protein ROG8370_00254 [Roseovarius gaetbuli]
MRKDYKRILNFVNGYISGSWLRVLGRLRYPKIRLNPTPVIESNP